MSKKLALVVGSLVLALGGAFAVVRIVSSDRAGPQPTITTVGAGTVVASVSATGNLVPLQQFTLDFSNPGRLVEVDVKPGDKVAKGQALAKIDDRAAQDELAKATAAMDDANAQLARDPDTASRLAVAMAAADLHAAQRALADTALVAPADALVASVTNHPGELVGGAAPTARLAEGAGAASGGFISLSDVSALPVRAAFSEADSARIKVGQGAEITFDALAGRSVQGTVSAMLTTPTVVNNVVTYPVTVTFPLFEGALPGMTANVAITVDKRESVPVIPNAAIATVGEFSEVVVVTGSRQTYRPITVGLQGDATTEVLSGLQLGERILADKPVAHEPDGDVIPPPVPGAAAKGGK